MRATQVQPRRYRTFAFGGGWCILGNQGERWWVSDGVYTIRAWAARLARSRAARYDRDWFDIGMWQMPGGTPVAQAITEAQRRLAVRQKQITRSRERAGCVVCSLPD